MEIRAVNAPPVFRRRGFSIIELLIAMAISLIVIAGLILVMTSVSSASRVQNGTARLQEGARFALQMIATDIRHASNQFCLNFAGADGSTRSGTAIHVDRVKPVAVRFEAGATPWNLGPAGTPAPFWLDPAEFVLGSECDGSTCAPQPALFPPVANESLADIGSVADARAGAADVLSLRYVSGTGLPIAAVESFRPDGQPAVIRLAPGSDGSTIGSILAGDCGTMIAARVTPLDPLTLEFSGNAIDDEAPGIDPAQARVFDLERDLQTVTYFLALKPDQAASTPPGRLVSTLMRRVDGRELEIARGIERLDFLYHLELADGATVVVPADQVDAAMDCRELAMPDGASVVASVPCGWRSLKGIEVFMLANTVDDVVPGGRDGNDDAFRYAWLADGTPNVDGQFEQPSALDVLPSGLPVGRMLRREFRTYVAIHGQNH